jgi:hypothetical protein
MAYHTCERLVVRSNSIWAVSLNEITAALSPILSFAKIPNANFLADWSLEIVHQGTISVILDELSITKMTCFGTVVHDVPHVKL